MKGMGIGIFALLTIFSAALYLDHQTYAQVSRASLTAAAVVLDPLEANKVCKVTETADYCLLPFPLKCRCFESETPTIPASSPTPVIPAPSAPTPTPAPNIIILNNIEAKQVAAANLAMCVQKQSLTARPCEYVTQGFKVIGRCVPDKGGVCRGEKYFDKYGKSHLMSEPIQVAGLDPVKSTFGSTPPPPSPKYPAVPAPSPQPLPAQGGAPAAPSGSTFNNTTPTPAYGSTPPPPPPPSAQTQIQNYANPVNNPYGGYGTNPLSPTQSPPTWNGDGFNSQARLSPENPYGYSEPSQGYGYLPYQPQTTFGGQYYPDSGYQSGGGFNPFVSLFANLFPRPNPVVNFIQSFVTPVVPNYLVNIQQISLQLLPEPIPRQKIVSYPLTPPPPFDLNKFIIAIARQDENRGEPNPTPLAPGVIRATGITNTDTSISSDGTPVPASPLGSDNPVGTINPRVDFFQNQNEQLPAFGAENREATSSQSTSSPEWRGARAVVIGVPFDITNPVSFQSIIASLNGDWTHVQRTSLQHKAALAQAESEYESAVANIGALQAAQDAGLCDEECPAAITVLQNQLPIQRSHVDELQSIVQQDEAPHDPPPPTIAQVTRIVERFAIPSLNGGGGVSAPPVVSVGAQEHTQSSGETRGEATVLRIVKGIWEFFKSLFVPRAPAAAPQPSCSLFLSLFGKCTQ